jgi:L-asparaginase/Glu-tRNA(Gln) amidotransferase subunit D
VKSAQCHSSWISGGPPGWSGSLSAFNMSWMCGIVVASTGNGHVIPAVSPNQR